ncbi:hypothetical protein [Phenylobacterium sp.]|uniref:alpha/beta fold hydrolase n=1 Tax=Phenylobacterium sp. TaxID=1871053 RepID=UPI002E32DC86|nr:hypothetical protein [Phenylobacterium sp.]HEX4712730.1 hypothetical protein [Phenylobacterium sp.]
MLQPLAEDRTPDLYGAGGSPPWPLTRAIRLRDEAEFIEPAAAHERAARVQIVEFDGLGHMGPATDPQAVNDEIARFLAVQG